MKIKDITNYLESLAPLSLQESYDNSGLITGNRNDKLKGVLITLDTTEDVIDEAMEKNANLIISHHPIIFKGLKRLTGNNYVERSVIKAIKNDIALYSIHTNLDNSTEGVNRKLSEKLDLEDCRILKPKQNLLRKLVTFVPIDHAEKVRESIFNAGAGQIGNYDSCSFNLSGEGTFRGGDNTNPYVGEKGKIHYENEIRVETIYPEYIEKNILKALFESHPYEEVAYDIYPLNNLFNQVGAGMIGVLKNSKTEEEFLSFVKNNLNCQTIRHTKMLGKKIKTVALCGGSGSFLINDAIRQKADAYISGDIKYHEFFDSDNKILIIDAGHYETEQFTKELIFDTLKKKFNNFACFLSEANTNPINYY